MENGSPAKAEIPGPGLESPPASATASPVPLRGITRKRFAVVLFLLHLPWLFHGCENQNIHLTAGLAVPFAKIEFRDRKPPQPVVLLWWSPWAFVGNAALLAAGLLVVCRRWPWARRLVQSRWFVTHLVFLAVLFDSILYLPPAWLYGVFFGTGYVAAAVSWLLSGGGEPNEATELLSVALGARLYYAACLVVPVLLTLGLRRYLRRYFFIAPDRWWQIRLSGLITAMLVLGAGLGLLARLLLPCAE